MSTYITDYLGLHPLSSEPYQDKREPIESRIFRILNRSKFRSAKPSDGTIAFIHDHIGEMVRNNKPIRLVYVFGGGKGINTYNFPNVSWSEYLHIKFLIENIHPIGQIYKPGVEIKWSMDDFGARIMNNYQADWQQTYSEGFNKLLAYFNGLYEGVNQELIPTATWYEFEDVKKNVVAKAKAKIGTPEASTLIATWKKRAENNFYNVDNLEGKALQDAIDFSTLLNTAWLEFDYENPERGKFFESGVPIAHFTDFPDCFYIQTVPGSNVQFWKANGYIEDTSGKLKSRIVSRNDWAEIESKLDFVKNPLEDSLPSLDKLPILNRS